LPEAVPHPRYEVVLRHARLASGAIVDLGIAAGRICARGPQLAASGSVELDAAGHLTLPGFVDPHLHLDKALSRGELREPPETLAEAITASRGLKAHWTEAAIEARATRAVTMALRAGTTALRTHVDVDLSLGLRGFHALCRIREQFSGQVRIQIVAFPQEGLDPAGKVEGLLRRALREGADAIGGLPALSPDPRVHIDRLFAIAKEHGADIDMHVDESDSPLDLSIEYLAERTQRDGYEGRVVAGHCTSLAAVDEDTLHRVLAAVGAAGISLVTLPSTNLYLQGRGDRPPVRRGLLPVRAAVAAGINVAYGSDNIRDAFTPFGNARMLETGLVLGHAAHMGSPAELRSIVRMATHNGARALRLPDYGLDEGCRADLVVLDAASPEDALVAVAPALWVVAGGKPVAGLWAHRGPGAADARLYGRG
jgi:cytosine deaminase